MKRGAVAFFAGVLFAVGLGLSGMTLPSKVIGFLDFAGQWDPSLAFVMVGAIGAHLLAVLAMRRLGAPLFADKFDLPDRQRVDAPLVAGAALFGVGWGLGGYCPGPAIVSVASGGLAAITFVLAMLLGMGIHARTARAASVPTA